MQWVGGDIPTSRAYYLSVNQLPVSLEQGAQGAVGAQVQVVYHMKALVTIAPVGAEPNVAAIATKPITYQPPAEAKGKPLPPTVPGVRNYHAQLLGSDTQ